MTQTSKFVNSESPLCLNFYPSLYGMVAIVFFIRGGARREETQG